MASRSRRAKSNGWKTIGIPLAVISAIVLLLPLVFSPVDHAERLLVVEATCHFQSVKACEGLLHFYEKVESGRDLARIAAKTVCASGNANACSIYGHLLEDVQAWPQAIKAYDQSCQLGEQAACTDHMILLSGAGRLQEAFEAGQALCQTSAQAPAINGAPTNYCYLTGVVARQMKVTASAEWAFYNGCTRDLNAESCVALGLSYLSHSERKRGMEAMGKGCELGLKVACDNSKNLLKMMRESPQGRFNALIQEHGLLREQLQMLASAKSGNHLADVAHLRNDLQNLQDRYRIFEFGADQSPAGVRDLYIRELNTELSSLSSLEARMRAPKSAAAKNFAAMWSRMTASQKQADAAFQRLPASN